jgi:C4-dicarboxylate transporter DctM subunit
MIGLLFGVLFAALFLGVPIAISLGVAVWVAMAVSGNTGMYLMIAQKMFTQADNTTLMAVPFFILAGNLMEKGSISERLIDFIAVLLRRIPGRLAGITVVASAFFGAISGSNPATVAAIGGITIPRMKAKGYPDEVAAAVAASGGTLGVVIPPSIPMVTYAVTASVSVGTMFLAGIVPGILLASRTTSGAHSMTLRTVRR